jgi:hypothetical protein
VRGANQLCTPKPHHFKAQIQNTITPQPDACGVDHKITHTHTKRKNKEHSPDQPLWRGMKMWAINATTGQGIWNISGAYQGGRNAMGALADGLLVTHNAMDNQIYAFGKGPSLTTITASPKVTTYGSSVLIEGTVMDIAEGTNQKEQAARFPTGIPQYQIKA